MACGSKPKTPKAPCGGKKPKSHKPKKKSGEDDLREITGSIKDDRGGLTARQLKFIEYYRGNGAEAARLAGYSENCISSIARYLLHDCEPVKQAIRAKGIDIDSRCVATRQELLERWTAVIRCRDGTDEDTGMMTKEQLRASENIARTLGMFIDTKEIKQTVTMPCGGLLSIDGLSAVAAKERELSELKRMAESQEITEVRGAEVTSDE